MRKTNDGETLDDAPFKQFSNDKKSFDGFADSDIVRDK